MLVALALTAAVLIAIVVTVVRTMPHPPPTEPITLDELKVIMPDAGQIELMAAIVRARIAQPNVAAKAPAASAPACVAPRTPHTWDRTQRENATTIVKVGVALDIPQRGQVVALATAIQESDLYNLGHLGANNDHDSLGLFQQRPSMGWGTPAQVTDPVYAATAFYLTLRRVRGWESMAVTVAAQKVQRSAFPNAYAKWEADAKALVQQIHCKAL
ncbi:MAG TPA: hypothetical protein VF163_02185 [Micromonosporaceae bacterium]